MFPHISDTYAREHLEKFGAYIRRRILAGFENDS